MRSEKLNLEHQSLLTPLLKNLQLDLSEYSFPCLYLSRDIHQYEVIFGKNIYIKGKTRDGFSYLMPTVPLNKISPEEWQTGLQEVDFFFPIPDEWLVKSDESLYQKSFKEEESDYIYSIRKLQEYPGRGLSKKRNLVHQFKNLYKSQVFSLTEERIPDAVQVIETWEKERISLGPSDYTSSLEAINLFRRLGLEGRITYVDAQPAAILLGEPLNDQMYLLHYFKGSQHYVGIYQFVLQEYALSLGTMFQEINMEADLGIPGLRQNKHSNHPDRMAIKFRTRLLQA